MQTGKNMADTLVKEQAQTAAPTTAQQRLGLALQGRLVYLALRCPLVNGGSCGALGAGIAAQNPVRRARRREGFAPQELVGIHVRVPYELRQRACAAQVNYSRLFCEALRRHLRRLAKNE